MKLITKEIEKALLATPLYSTEKTNVAPVLVKFFYPYGSGTWYVLEAKREGNDWLFFGLTDLHEKELGYFRLSDLLTIVKFGRPAIERDKFFSKYSIDKSRNQLIHDGKDVAY